MNAYEVMANINRMLAENDKHNEGIKPWNRMNLKWKIDKVYDDLGIFDWWNEELSVSQLKQMKNFLQAAIKRGYDQYVCFKVGAKYCSHGMWAYNRPSTDGYSPDEGGCLYHSFRSGDNYWDVQFDDGRTWAHDLDVEETKGKEDFTLREVDALLAKYNN